MDLFLDWGIRSLIVSYLSRSDREEEEDQEATFFCRYPQCKNEKYCFFYSFYYRGYFPSDIDLNLDLDPGLLEELFTQLCKTGNVGALAVFLERYPMRFVNVSEHLAFAAKHNHLDMFSFLLEHPSGTPFRVQANSIVGLYFLAKNGHLDTFRDLFQRVSDHLSLFAVFPSDINAYFNATCKGGSLLLLRFLLSKYELPYKKELYCIAAANDHVHLLHFFDSEFSLHQDKEWTPRKTKYKVLDFPKRVRFYSTSSSVSRTHFRAYEIAARKGKMNVLNYLENKFPLLQKRGIYINSIVSCVKVLKHFLSKKRYPLSRLKRLFLDALSEDRVAIAKYIDQNNPHELTLNIGKEINHLFRRNWNSKKTLEFISNRFSTLLEISTIEKAFKMQAKSEFCESFIWFLERFPFLKEEKRLLKLIDISQLPYSIKFYLWYKVGIPVDSHSEFQHAILCGDLERVKSLSPFCYPEEEILQEAATEGHFSIIRHLVQTFPLTTDEKESIFQGAIMSKKLSFIKFAMELFNEYPFSRKQLECAFFYAFHSQHLETVKLLHERNTTFTFSVAPSLPTLELVKYVEKHHLLNFEKHLDQLFIGAVVWNQFDIAEFLLKKASCKNLQPETVRAAFDRGYEPSLKRIHFLLEHRDQLGITIEHILPHIPSKKNLDNRELLLYLHSLFLGSNGIGCSFFEKIKS